MTSPADRKALAERLRVAWADHCGIGASDDRAVDPENYGWPQQFGYFKAGWDAALREQDAASVARIKAMEVHHKLCPAFRMESTCICDANYAYARLNADELSKGEG